MRVGRAVRIVIGTGLVLTGLAVGGGVSGVATHPASAATIRAAAADAQSASSIAFELSVTVDVGGAPVTIRGTGVFGGQLGRMTLTVPVVGTLEERLTPDGVYLDLGAVPGSGLPAGKRWLFVSRAALTQQSGLQLPVPASGEPTDPRQALENLQALAGPVTTVGPDVVNGSPATHYRVTIDYAQEARDNLSQATPEVRAALAALGSRPADVWIDGSDRLVKFSQDLDVTASGQTVHAAVTMTITGYDVPLDVQAPPADQVYDLAAARGIV